MEGLRYYQEGFPAPEGIIGYYASRLPPIMPSRFYLLFPLLCLLLSTYSSSHLPPLLCLWWCPPWCCGLFCLRVWCRANSGSGAGSSARSGAVAGAGSSAGSGAGSSAGWMPASLLRFRGIGNPHTSTIAYYFFFLVPLLLPKRVFGTLWSASWST